MINIMEHDARVTPLCLIKLMNVDEFNQIGEMVGMLK